MEKKLTKKEIFAQMLSVEEIANNPLFAELINKQIEQLNKKKSSKKGLESEVNTELKNDILDLLRENPNKLFSATEIQKAIGSKYEDKFENGLTNQRVCSIIRPLIDIEVKRTVDKRKAYFSLM